MIGSPVYYALSGLPFVSVLRNPGRCPGLSYCAPSGRTHGRLVALVIGAWPFCQMSLYPRVASLFVSDPQADFNSFTSSRRHLVSALLGIRLDFRQVLRPDLLDAQVGVQHLVLLAVGRLVPENRPGSSLMPPRKWGLSQTVELTRTAVSPYLSTASAHPLREIRPDRRLISPPASRGTILVPPIRQAKLLRANRITRSATRSPGSTIKVHRLALQGNALPDVPGPDCIRRPRTVECELARLPVVQPNGAWRSLAARLLWEQEVDGSNPFAPTCYKYRRFMDLGHLTTVGSAACFFSKIR